MDVSATKARVFPPVGRCIYCGGDGGGRLTKEHIFPAGIGGGLVKQRLPRPGQGKSGGYRTVIAIKRGDRAVFLYGFAKNERSNIDADELEEFRQLARAFLGLTVQQIAALIADNELMEVTDDDDG